MDGLRWRDELCFGTECVVKAIKSCARSSSNFSASSVPTALRNQVFLPERYILIPFVSEQPLLITLLRLRLDFWLRFGTRKRLRTPSVFFRNKWSSRTTAEEEKIKWRCRLVTVYVVIWKASRCSFTMLIVAKPVWADFVHFNFSHLLSFATTLPVQEIQRFQIYCHVFLIERQIRFVSSLVFI